MKTNMSLSLEMEDAERFDKFCTDNKLKHSAGFRKLIRENTGSAKADEFRLCNKCNSTIRGDEKECPLCKIRTAENMPETLHSDRIQLLKAKIAYKRNLAKRLFERNKGDDKERSREIDAELILIEKELFELEHPKQEGDHGTEQ